MDAITEQANQAEQETVVVNRNLVIEVTLDEILEDLLFGVRG